MSEGTSGPRQFPDTRKHVVECHQQAKKLKLLRNFEALCDFCATTRVAFWSILHCWLFTGGCPDSTVRRFLHAIVLGRSVGLELEQTLVGKERDQAGAYLSSIKFREELLGTLMDKGVVAVGDALLQETIIRLSAASDEFASEAAEPELPDAEELQETARQLRETVDQLTQTSSNVVCEDAQCTAPNQLLGSAFSRSAVELSLMAMELVGEKGPFKKSVPDHLEIAEGVFDNLNRLLEKLRTREDVAASDSLKLFGDQIANVHQIVDQLKPQRWSAESERSARRKIYGIARDAVTARQQFVRSIEALHCGAVQELIEQDYDLFDLDEPEVLEVYDGWIERIDEGIAYLTLRSSDGRELFGQYDAQELGEKGITEETPFLTCRTIERAGGVDVEIGPATVKVPTSVHGTSQGTATTGLCDDDWPDDY